MLAAGRTYGQGLARSTLSVSRRSRLIAPGPESSALPQVSSAHPVSAQIVARQQHNNGGGTLPDDRPLTVTEEQTTPWLKYQRHMYQRTGLQDLQGLQSLKGLQNIQSLGNRRRRRRPGAVSPTTASATAVTATPEKSDGFKIHGGSTPSSVGAPVKDADGGALTPAPTPSKPAATAASIAPAAERLKLATAAGDQGLPMAGLPPASTATATPAEKSSVATPPPPPSAEPVIPRSPWEKSPGGSVGGIGSMDKWELIAEMERKSGKRVEQEGGAHSGNGREAALNAELERKFGKNPGREPEPEPEPVLGGGRRDQGAPRNPGPPSGVGIADGGNGGGGGDGDGDGGGDSDATAASPESQRTGNKKRKRGRRGRGKGPRQIDGDGDGTVSEGSEIESRQDRDLRAAETGGGGGSDPESDGFGVVAGTPAPGDGGGSPTPRNRSRRTRFHYQMQGSAWKNVHAKKNLNRLLVGLGNDYGVKEMLSAHHVSENTLSKVLPIFQDLVINDPNTAFDGKGCQKIQKTITSLCYDESFAADAVLMRKPVRAKSLSGRTFAFPSASSADRGGGGRRDGETPFVKKRNSMVEHSFIPRLVQLAQERFPEELETAKRMAAIVDLRDPHEAFPLARLRKRRIIYHGGPTNSGKTYQAIERLKKAGSGVDRQPGEGPVGLFCGPLRLLALEVYEQLNSQGVYCNLNTGQEKREVPFATHVSCTIEMASTEHEYEVAVVDEIQMLADEQRGPSWTATVLGLNCPEIHVCGGMEGAVLVEAMAKEMGDEFELKEYQRKTELVCAEESLGNSYKNIQPGDAVVAFSRKDIFNIKREIESKTPHKCCVIFGSLPQETRAHQARLFNTEDTGYDVLVASDAIGMGLNLNIRRVVFHAVSKRAGGGRAAVKLPPTVLKQIGGRAGRHGKQWEFGEVTCLSDSDMPYMNQVMNTPLESIPKAAIFPTVQRMQEFSNCLDKVEPEDQVRRRLAQTYASFAGKARVGDRYFLGTHDQYQTLANTLHPIENLTLKERYAISMAPVNGRNALLMRAIFLFASAHAAGLPVFINMQLPQKGVLPNSLTEFQTLCSKHSVLDLYRWMGVRFPSIECFAEKSVADIQRLELESMINQALKRRIAVTGPDSISAPGHDAFDKKVIRALNNPNGAALRALSNPNGAALRALNNHDGADVSVAVTGSVEDEEHEDGGVEYQF